jgi:hypothetical protein
VGDEDPGDLIGHLVHAARLALDPHVNGFSQGFMSFAQADALIKECYLQAHRRYIESKVPLA